MFPVILAFALFLSVSPSSDQEPKEVTSELRISAEGIDHVKRYEGLRLKTYVGLDNPTIGYGHTGYATEYSQITEEMADDLLHKDLAHAQKHVRLLVSVPVTQKQFDALVSFVYNVGIGAFKRSTLLKKLNKGNYAQAATELMRWVHVKGVVIQGLVKRRQSEYDWFTN